MTYYDQLLCRYLKLNLYSSYNLPLTGDSLRLVSTGLCHQSYQVRTHFTAVSSKSRHITDLQKKIFEEPNKIVLDETLEARHVLNFSRHFTVLHFVQYGLKLQSMVSIEIEYISPIKKPSQITWNVQNPYLSNWNTYFTNLLRKVQPDNGAAVKEVRRPTPYKINSKF